MAYKDKADSGSRDFGMVVRNPMFKGSFVRPLYTKKDAAAISYTVIRPVGPLRADRTDFLPWRNSAGAGDIGVGGVNDWFFKEDVFDGGTAARVTFLAAKLGEDGRPLDPSMEPSIAHEFYRLARKFAKGTVLELKLLQGSSNAGAPLRMPRTNGFVQGMMLERGPDKYYKAPRMNTVLMLAQTARVACYNQLEELTPGYVGDPDDLSRRFLAGDLLAAKRKVASANDPTSYDAGRVLRFWGVEGGGGIGEEQTDGETDWKAAVNGGEAGRPKKKDKEEIGSYNCSFGPQPFPDLPRKPNGEIAIDDNLLFVPWDKVFRYLTDEEMCHQLVRAYFDYPEVLRAGLEHIPGALPASVLRGRTISQPAPAAAAHSQAPVTSPAAAAAAAAATQPPSEESVVFAAPESATDQLEEQPPAPGAAAAPAADTAKLLASIPGMTPEVMAALQVLQQANQAKK
jgi:hypothetical protein